MPALPHLIIRALPSHVPAHLPAHPLIIRALPLQNPGESCYSNVVLFKYVVIQMSCYSNVLLFKCLVIQEFKYVVFSSTTTGRVKLSGRKRASSPPPDHQSTPQPPKQRRTLSDNNSTTPRTPKQPRTPKDKDSSFYLHPGRRRKGETPLADQLSPRLKEIVRSKT